MNKNIKTSKIGVAAAILGSMILSSSTDFGLFTDADKYL